MLYISIFIIIILMFREIVSQLVLNIDTNFGRTYFNVL
jgi:hypothetical protein